MHLQQTHDIFPYSLVVVIPHFFDQMPRLLLFYQMPRLLLFSPLAFVWLLFEGSDHLRAVLIFLRKAHGHERQLDKVHMGFTVMTGGSYQ